MNRFAEIIRVIIISPEVLFGTISVLVLSTWPVIAENLGTHVKAHDWVCVTAVGLLVGFVTYIVKAGCDLLSPTGELKQAIMEWPEYYRLKYRIVAGFVITAMSCAIAVLTACFAELLDEYIAGMVIMTAVVVSASTAATFVFASFAMKEVVR